MLGYCLLPHRGSIAPIKKIPARTLGHPCRFAARAMGPSREISRSNPDGETTRTGTDAEPADVAEGSIDSTDVLMARVRPAPPAGAPLARARVLGAMFGDQSAAGAIGRFRVLERLGAGGMGVVYEAYDPDLARGVALKLVNVAAKDRETALAEAKALARLSHPNVVPIYDVGLERDRVYLVMELVRGKTLRQWSPGHTSREILDMYQQAGRALAAAHDAGLVHRDFKPDNAIVGTDGRIRVVDFGLACEADDPDRATSERRNAAGTPRFMAPEIKAGAAITPAADQYSFCVALAEALADAREPMLRRVADVLERGRAADPAERFASMADLLRALARDPARIFRRVAAVGGLALCVGALAFFAGRHNPSQAPDACDGGAAQLEAAWSRTARSTALDRLATLGAYGQTLRPTLDRVLDDYVTRWERESRAACLDYRRGAVSDTLADRRTACLDEGRHDLAEAGKLITAAGAASLVQLPLALQSMRDPSICSDLASLASDVEPPPQALVPQVSHVRNQIWQARFQVGAGRYGQALVAASAAVADARALGYHPALAEALLVQGHARMNLPERGAAVPILTEAIQVANLSRARALAIEAWARRAYALGTSTDPDGAAAGLDFVESEAKGTASAAFALALLYNNLGSVELARNHRAAAHAYFERALDASRKVIGRGAYELVNIRVNLGMVTDDRVQGDALIAQAAAELTNRLGADHPDTLHIRQQRGFVTIEDLRTAEELLTPVCRAYELHVTLVDDVVECWTEVGLVRADLGQRRGAIEALELAVRAASDATEAAAYIALFRGDPRGAVRQFADAVAAKPPQQKEPSWKRASRAMLTLGLGRARLDMGDLRGAREAFEWTIADLQPYIREHPGARYERRLGRARVGLAITLISMGEHSAERSAVARAGVVWLRRVGGQPSEITLLRE
jgi:tetratricopeptide (TPR) repeat protein/predicted Ser/Thr protein kinase